MKNRKLVSDKIEKALNNQIEMEAEASFKYLGMNSWCESEGLKGCASFLLKQAEEENTHMMKIFNYLNSAGGFALPPGVKKPEIKYKNVKELFENALRDEKEVTNSIYKIIDMAKSEKDHATFQFLQFFVEEQFEEEVLFTDVLDKIDLIGLDGKGLYYIDKEVKSICDGKVE